MTAVPWLDRVDSRAWSTATWSAPLMTQLVLALVIATSWLFGKWFPGTSGLLSFFAAAGVVALLCVVTVMRLITLASPRAQGVALSIAGSLAIVLVGASVYGFWILQW